ncbi:hypothetical protein AB0P02_21475 [Streptomyces griseoluteus]|uniref:hypothetical protein n=1 Tax=Streptomyces griseoluteus TaxID=29306 RepID=UPI00342A52F8
MGQSSTDAMEAMQAGVARLREAMALAALAQGFPQDGWVGTAEPGDHQEGGWPLRRLRHWRARLAGR